MKQLLFIYLLLHVALVQSGIAQTRESRRYEIDAKRVGVSPTSKEGLAAGREYIRIDSTYYIGWMYVGLYKFEHAADYLGYKSASVELSKALNLLEKDFKLQIRTRTANVMEYIPMLKYHRDWDMISYSLMQCYSNIEDANATWALLQRCKKADLQDEIYMDTYSYLAWTVHRNRFYTSSKYPFLKNSIDENEQYANRLLDSMYKKIKRDAALNKTIFSADYEKEKSPSVWHYKSILYSYQLNIESAAYYYEKLKSTAVFPANNYATFCMIQGKFAEANEFYNTAKLQDAGDKRMKESYYYLSIINSYKANTNSGIAELKDLIKANGSTPGFGWYNIALARLLLYQGELEQAQVHINRAEEFKEIHIGTTLGQSHYDFSVSLMKLIHKMKEIEFVKFSNKGWWYSPISLLRLAKLTIDKYSLQFLIINQFALNPERDRVIYKLFSTESTVSFDEIWYLIDGFSTNYFLKRFENEIRNDKRYNVKRYYRYFVARLYMKKGNYKEAEAQLQSILNDILLDKENEKLLLVRTQDAILDCKMKNSPKENYSDELINLYKLYPQLIPFSQKKLPARINAITTNDVEKDIVKRLKKYNLNWNPTSGKCIDVHLVFKQSKTSKIVECSSKLDGELIKSKTQMTYKDVSDAALKIIQCIFEIRSASSDDSSLYKK